jgi:hypothetical protein
MATPGLTEPVFNFVPQGRRRHEGATASSWNFLKNEHLDKFERVEASKSVRNGACRLLGDSDDETHTAAAKLRYYQCAFACYVAYHTPIYHCNNFPSFHSPCVLATQGESQTYPLKFRHGFQRRTGDTIGTDADRNQQQHFLVRFCHFNVVDFLS